MRVSAAFIARRFTQIYAATDNDRPSLVGGGELQNIWGELA